MTSDIIVLGDLFEDLYYESNFYEEHAKLIATQILNFIKYNPDDLSKSIIKKLVIKGFSDNLIQNNGRCYFKRGGVSGISEFFTRSGITTKLLSIIRKEGEWMVDELAKIGVDTTNIIYSNEILPIRIIVPSNNGTKILLKPNLTYKWALNEKILKDFEFHKSKLILCASISNAYITLLEKGSKLGLLTAFKVEDETSNFDEQFRKSFKSKHDILFLHLKDTGVTLKEKSFTEQIDKKYSNYAKIRVFTSEKKDTAIRTEELNLYFPPFVEEKQIGSFPSEESFLGGFLIKFLELINDKESLNELLISKNIEKLKAILIRCEEFAVNFKK